MVGHIISVNLRYNNVLYHNVNVGLTQAKYEIFTFTTAAFVHETMFKVFINNFGRI